MFTDKFTLKSQFLVAILIPCTALLVIAIASFNSMSVIYKQSKELYSSTSAPMRYMSEVASRLPRMRAGIDMIFLQETPLKDSKGIEIRVQETRGIDMPEMENAIEKALESQVKIVNKQEVEKLQNMYNQMSIGVLNPMMKALENHNFDAARKIYREDYTVQYSLLVKDTNQILDNLLQQGKEEFSLSNQSYKSGQKTMITIIISAILTSFVVSFVILSSLKKRVAILRNSISTAVETKALDTPINLPGRDELSDIGNSFNIFLGSINASIKEVSKRSKDIALAADQLSERAGITQNNCTSQRDQTIQVATAISELNATVTEIASSAAHAAEGAKQAAYQTESGSVVVANTSQQIVSFTHEIEEATIVIQSLATQVEDISSILDTIRAISEQTNLLALNAAIEAARAGEQGRGFAVVADEVRNLASRSADSTEEIQLVINRLQDESKRAVQAMMQGRDQSILVVQEADKANQALKKINLHIESINDLNIQVATATEEQACVVNDINRNLEDINLLTVETTQVAEHLTESSEHLQEVSQQLDGLVASFRI
ncbi:methyl-accepting chemotaxis protein [Photobacterium halotolerans]|uniref:methyl-accepting chemotaxis protein n=1 Tax=Photobacterium halotolerans TaxID=265726 RepID=UPI000426752F|nr:methyl-accepting chemotaxis protein [Photobacterium halotolerans]